MQSYDVVIIGAGAAGMFCASEAARRGRRVLIVDHNRTPGDKIRISGGGRCNFTNLYCKPENFLSQNPKFAISALSRFNQSDFIALIEQHGILWHEKSLGQLFCDGSARQIIEMLVSLMTAAGAELRLSAVVNQVRHVERKFCMSIDGQQIRAESLVVACGGKSIPKMGASDFGYRIATQFGLKIEDTRPALVPLTFAPQELVALKTLAGLSLDARVSCGSMGFREGMLFTHRGLSGPSILQISSYWREGQTISVDLLPGQDAVSFLRFAKKNQGRLNAPNTLAQVIPKRLAQLVCKDAPQMALANFSDAELLSLAARLSSWHLKPIGSEGYRTAEVTLGGVSTDALDARTMQANKMPGLYFIGEVVDVTGWLGGYNFQWAWSSGWAAGQVV